MQRLQPLVAAHALGVLGALGTGPLGCPDAADPNDSGDIDLSDPVFLLRYLFLGGETLPTPGPDACGWDGTRDGLARCALPCP